MAAGDAGRLPILEGASEGERVTIFLPDVLTPCPRLLSRVHRHRGRCACRCRSPAREFRAAPGGGVCPWARARRPLPGAAEAELAEPHEPAAGLASLCDSATATRRAFDVRESR